MKNVISYNAEGCINCIKCLKSCPNEAITMVDGKVHIDDNKCINCDVCVKGCPQHALSAKGSHIEETFKNYDYKVALVSTAILSDANNIPRVKSIFKAIKRIGFDEVLSYSDIEGDLYLKAQEYTEKHEGIWLTSFCPTMNRYVETNYPTLIDNLLPFDYPVEIAARKVRERLKDKGKVGIYSICECIGKLELAKQPYGNENSNIDHAVTISHIFPKINRLINEEEEDIEINRYGVKSVVSDLFGNHNLSVITVEGLNQSRNLMELLEFDRIEHARLIALYACYQGCIGGCLLWSNPFEGAFHMKNLVDKCTGKIAELNEDEYIKVQTYNESEQKSMKEKVAWFNKVNEIQEQLPQFDCGSCGYANCRGLAEAVARGKADINLCRVKKG